MPALRTEHPAARLHALEAAGGLAYWQSDGDAAERWYTEALELARAAGDPAGEANALYNLTFAAVYAAGRTPAEGDEQAREHGLGALEIYRRLGDRPAEARALWAISNTYWQREHHRRGRPVRRARRWRCSARSATTS